VHLPRGRPSRGPAGDPGRVLTSRTTGRCSTIFSLRTGRSTWGTFTASSGGAEIPGRSAVSEKDPQFGGAGKIRKTPLGTTLYFSSEDEIRDLFRRHSPSGVS